MDPSPASSRFALRLEQTVLFFLALCVALVPLAFYTQSQDQFELPKNVLLRILTSFALGAALSARLLRPQAWRRSPLDWPLLAFSLWLGFKTLNSISPALSWRGEYENFAGSLTQLNYSLLFYLSVQFVDRGSRARALALAILWGALGASAYGLLQACQRDFIGWAAESYISDRFFGSLGNPNFLAGLACMAIPLKLALAWEEQGQAKPGRDWAWWGRLGLLGLALLAYAWAGRLGRLDLSQSVKGEDLGARLILSLWLLGLAGSFALWRSGRWRWALGLGQALDLLVLFKALANTGTRGGFLGLMVGLGVLGLGWLRLSSQGRSLKSLLPRLGLGVLATLLLVSVAIAGLGSSFRQRVTATLKDPSYAIEASRLQIWVPAIRIWRANPWTGTGVDTFKSVFPSYSTSRFNKYDGENVSSRMAHCEPLQILATMGLIGLALWTWFCGAMAWAAWRRLDPASGARFFVLGLGALLAAYLAQNLVSFGVAGISVPFFIAAALLFAGEAPAAAAARPALLGWLPAAALGLAAALMGASLAFSTLRADLDYAMAFQIHRQLQGSENMGADEALGMGAYAVQNLQAYGKALNPDIQAEHDLWLPMLQNLAQQLQAKPADAARIRPALVQGSSALLYALAAQHMEDAVATCPQEVKYYVYEGLAYEELFKRSQGQRREFWFNKARGAYEQTVALNPQNAYYHGNLGRLFGMGAEAGAAEFLPEAAKHYEEAIRIAPVTRLFYENLLLLYARYAKLKEAQAQMDSLVARDPEMAPSILIAAASTFYQWRGSNTPAWGKAERQAALPVILAWGRQAVALAPPSFRDPRDKAAFGDYALTLAVFEQASGHRAEAKAAIAKAMDWKPGDKNILDYKAQQKL